MSRKLTVNFSNGRKKIYSDYEEDEILLNRFGQYIELNRDDKKIFINLNNVSEFTIENMEEN